jgi:DNA polymerase I-like protein with 3'-5' exonuclease and polymerase domains
MRLYWDIEATNLLNSDSVDYTQSPYQLKPDFKVHCAVFIDVDAEQEYEFVGHKELLGVKDFILNNATELIAQNSISYDHMVMMAAYGIDFEIGVNEGVVGKQYSLKVDSVCGVPMTITDTLVMSKTLNPTRAAHSIDYFGRLLGLEKIDWRAKAVELGLCAANDPPGAEFKTYHPEMLVYCKRDCYVGIKVWKFLMNEWGTWQWDNAYQLEKCVAEIVTHQEHRGFYFHKEKAIELVKDLDEKMEHLKNVVEPLIPPKPIGKTAAKEFIPPKIQFKKDGNVSAVMEKWVAKHGGVLDRTNDVYRTVLFGNEYLLPIPQEPLVTHVPATLRDTTHIKGWLVEIGWSPSAYKERDLSVDSRKVKLSLEKYVESVERYVEQTATSPFKKDRLDHLEVRSIQKLREKLLKHDHYKRPIKVLTNPTLTVGVEKDIDPKLLELSHKFAHAKDISDYLTYSHRRNSILGGGIDPDDDDEEMEKGWMSVDRINQDHRIPTPADTCGAASSRFKHRLVANIPRVTSLYGEELRSLFGVDTQASFVQVGYDFDGLEARVESHYCWRYDDEDHSYCASLLGEKPNDVHTLTAKKISVIIGEIFGRTPAKTVKYAAAYGARPARIAKTVGCSLELGEKIFDAYWEAAKPLGALGEKLASYWETVGGKKFILGIDGRKIYTRSKSALINFLFQSTGVIAAKRAMVIHDRKLKREGFRVNFWKDDWKNMKFCQQLIAYHDESQLEVHRSLVSWKLFETEEEAKIFKKSQNDKVWSDVGHSAKGFYTGYCRPGELAVESVREAGEYYKLNVELTAGYMLGTTWASCH